MISKYLLAYPFRYGLEFVKTCVFLKDSQWWDRKRLEANQMQQLGNLLNHAYKNVPYYQRLFDDLGLKPQDIQSFEDFGKIPFLTKDIIRAHYSSLRATSFAKEAFVAQTTGGSSGVPLSFFNQRGFSGARERAFVAVLWQRAGFNYGRDKRLVLKGPTIDSNSGMKYQPLHRELICSTYHMTDKRMRGYFKEMKRRQIRFIHGHPSSIVIFAQFMIRNGLSYSLQAVLGGSEKVFPFQRELVRLAFGTRIFSWYGNSEQVVLAGECEFSENYHVFPEYGFMELVDGNGNRIASPENRGEIVGTSLNNYVMPFIRYRTGDIGEYATSSCSCGREYTLLKDVEGRKYEYILTRDGRIVSLTALIFGQHFKAFGNMEKIQLYQEKEGEVEIRIVKSSAYTSKDEDEITSTIKKAVGFGLDVTYSYVDDIPQTESGKHRFLIQRLPLSLDLVISHQ